MRGEARNTQGRRSRALCTFDRHSVRAAHQRLVTDPTCRPEPGSRSQRGAIPSDQRSAGDVARGREAKWASSCTALDRGRPEREARLSRTFASWQRPVAADWLMRTGPLTGRRGRVESTERVDLRLEASTMALYVSVVLLATLAAIDDTSNPSDVKLVEVIWGTTLGLALVHFFAFRVSSRLVRGTSFHRHDLHVAFTSLGGALAVAVACSIPVIMLPPNTENDVTRYLLALVLGIAGYVSGRTGAESVHGPLRSGQSRSCSASPWRSSRTPSSPTEPPREDSWRQNLSVPGMLRTPRSAAIAGIVFAVLLGTASYCCASRSRRTPAMPAHGSTKRGAETLWSSP